MSEKVRCQHNCGEHESSYTVIIRETGNAIEEETDGEDVTIRDYGKEAKLLLGLIGVKPIQPLIYKLANSVCTCVGLPRRNKLWTNSLCDGS